MLLAALLLNATAPIPTGVNGIVLGTADDYKVQGPARVCLNMTSVDLEAGETAFLSYLGIHNGEFEVHSSRGFFKISESEIYKTGGATGPAELVIDSTMAYWDDRSPKPAYALFPASNRRQRVANVSGDLVTGSRADKQFLARISVGLKPRTGCTHTFRYGWDEILGLGEPPKSPAGETK